MIEYDTGRKVKALNNLIRRFFENIHHENNDDKVTVTNGWILRYLSENTNKDVFQKDLEEKFTITRSTASKVVDLMVKKGFIVRESVDYDARLKKLVMTDKAVKTTKEMKKNAFLMESKLVKGFTDEEVKLLNSYIDRMIQNMMDKDQI